ncbi:hypothetical protein AYI70_g6924 [Smittium culicis]|uniref:Uncharacterized protein n=1 Tax=Smittium culicis TaxID=133412 RepID=A0A1R1XMR3_9FUNG|nr:hypothetical protein AYI70_g6924 [Smittium culicis]
MSAFFARRPKLITVGTVESDKRKYAAGYLRCHYFEAIVSDRCARCTEKDKGTPNCRALSAQGYSCGYVWKEPLESAMRAGDWCTGVFFFFFWNIS